MPFKIYTFKNPNKLRDEEYWDEIKSLPWVCASQVIVNSYQKLFRIERSENLYITAEQLLETFYSEWLNPVTRIEIYTAIDNCQKNIIQSINSEDFNIEESAELSFSANRAGVLESIRTLFELDYQFDDRALKELPIDQSILVTIFNQIKNNGKISDKIQNDFSFDEIKKNLSSLINSNHDSRIETSIDNPSIVFTGIHQFNPLLAKLLCNLAKFMTVILAFNYDDDYAPVYQTWLNVYAPLNVQTTVENNLNSEIKETESRELAKKISSLYSGKRVREKMSGSKQIIEFEDITDFANYVSNIFENAKRESKKRPNINPLRMMREKFYATDTSVNSILKTYFPEQFNKKVFMDYPIGRYIYALMKIWNPEFNRTDIKDWENIRIILSSGVIPEKHPGYLLSIFDMAFPYIERSADLGEIIKRLENLKELYVDDEQVKNQIGYFSLKENQLEDLISGFSLLKRQTQDFFGDFENNKDNFRNFYQKLQNFIDDQIKKEETETEYRNFICGVSEQIRKLKNITSRGTFDCLRSTMKDYLQPEENEQLRSSWIVKGFRQIEGDVLYDNSDQSEEFPIYHFACLTDEGIFDSSHQLFPWPLTQSFFDNYPNQKNKTAVKLYVNSVNEHDNYNRYALIYGLSFNPGKVKLSYIKSQNGKTQNLYYPFKILQFETMPFKKYLRIEHNPIEEVDLDSNVIPEMFNHQDLYNLKVCNYLFLMESLIQDRTVYNDSFLIKKFIEALIENRIRFENAGTSVWKNQLVPEIEDYLDNYIDSEYLPSLSESERLDIIRNIYQNLNKIKEYPNWNSIQQNRADARMLLFRQESLKKVDETTDFEEELSAENLDYINYDPIPGEHCRLCPVKNICLKIRGK